MLEIKPVSYSEILDDPNSAELLAEYSEECSIPEIGKGVPCRELYELMEKSGVFQAFGVYDEDGELMGFAAVNVFPLAHYGKTIAATESIFVPYSRRGNGAGTKLKAFVKQYAKNRGCVAFQYVAPFGSRFERLLASDKGCRRTGSVFTESL